MSSGTKAGSLASSCRPLSVAARLRTTPSSSALVPSSSALAAADSAGPAATHTSGIHAARGADTHSAQGALNATQSVFRSPPLGPASASCDEEELGTAVEGDVLTALATSLASPLVMASTAWDALCAARLPTRPALGGPRVGHQREARLQR